jgi:hypothetical protein
LAARVIFPPKGILLVEMMVSISSGRPPDNPVIVDGEGVAI